eukprot:scaffold596_cov95-Isochrysis_galbana.AAC.3
MAPGACCGRSSGPRHEWRARRGRAPPRPPTRPADALSAAAPPAPSRPADGQTLQLDGQTLELDRSVAIRPEGVQLRSLLEPHGGLPRFAAAVHRGASAASPLRVCYLGGSVTEQKAGWRPLVTAWIESQLAAGGGGRGAVKDGAGLVQEIPAWCGNSGSKARVPQATPSGPPAARWARGEVGSGEGIPAGVRRPSPLPVPPVPAFQPTGACFGAHPCLLLGPPAPAFGPTGACFWAHPCLLFSPRHRDAVGEARQRSRRAWCQARTFPTAPQSCTTPF